MARSTGEVQADIALMRRVIERKLDALHGHLPKRWWLSYAWLAGGLGGGLLLSQVPLLALTTSTLRLVQVGLGLVTTLNSVLHVLDTRGLALFRGTLLAETVPVRALPSRAQQDEVMP